MGIRSTDGPTTPKAYSMDSIRNWADGFGSNGGWCAIFGIRRGVSAFVVVAICPGDGMSIPSYLVEREGVTWLAVKAQPRSKKNEIVGLVGNELKIRISAPPVDSAANEALVEFLAEILHCPRRSVSLVRGASSTHKQFRIEGVTTNLVLERIQAATVK